MTVDVALDGALPRGARPDLTVDGTIELERMDDVLFVGRPVFGQEESVVSLFRVEADAIHASRTRVSLGRASVNTIEVLGPVILPSQIRAFVFGSLMAGLMIAAATRTMHAQTLDTVVAQSVAQLARQAGQPARRFDLTLDAAVQRALERNLDIAVQRIHPLVQDMQIVAANAAFLPFASSGLILDQATAPNRFVFDGGGLAGQSIVTDLGVYDVAIGQQMKWGGGRYDVAWDSTRWESTNIFSTFNPSFGANMTLQYTQPLLRGFRTDARRTQLVVSRINRDISDIDLEETIVNTLAGVSELALKELIVGGTTDEMWNAEIYPTDEPRIELTPIDPAAGDSRGARAAHGRLACAPAARRQRSDRRQPPQQHPCLRSIWSAATNLPVRAVPGGFRPGTASRTSSAAPAALSRAVTAMRSKASPTPTTRSGASSCR